MSVINSKSSNSFTGFGGLGGGGNFSILANCEKILWIGSSVQFAFVGVWISYVQYVYCGIFNIRINQTCFAIFVFVTVGELQYNVAGSMLCKLLNDV
jgi:hypothetical protein